MASYRKLPSGKWQATVKHPSGKRYTKTDPLKRVVVEWAGERETEIRRGDFIDPDAGKATLEEWWTKWSSTRQLEKATIAKRESLWRVHVAPAFASWPLISIQSWDIEAWLASMRKKKVGDEAAASAYRLLKQLLSEATRHKLIRSNPAELVTTPKGTTHDDRILDIGEADRLIASITKPDHSARVPRGEKLPRVPDLESQLMVRTMLDAGLRWQEVTGLHVFRVNLMRRKLRVQEVAERDGTIKAEPKTANGVRDVPLTDELVAGFSVLLAGMEKDALVFGDEQGRPLNYANWLKRVWRPAVAAAKLADPQPTPHDCRHSYGSWLADAGVPPHQIRDLMGHGSLRAVERYVHSSESRMDRARDALGARRAHEGPEKRSGPASRSSGNGA